MYTFPHVFDRSRYTPLYLMRHLSESEVQAEIVSQLRALRVDVIAIDAGGKKTRGLLRQGGGDPVLLARLSTKTDLKGFPDLEATLAPEGRALYIEVKHPEHIVPKGNFGSVRLDDPRTFEVKKRAHKATPEQLAFLQSKADRGAIALVAWSVDDVFAHAGAFIHHNEKHMRGKN